MDLAFIITAHYPGGYPETTIVESTDAAILSLAAYLRPFVPSDMTDLEVDQDAAMCVEEVMESPGLSMEIRRGEVRVSITLSRLAGE